MDRQTQIFVRIDVSIRDIYPPYSYNRSAHQDSSERPGGQEGKRWRRRSATARGDGEDVWGGIEL